MQGSAAALEVHSADELIAVAHDAGDALVALLLPALNRVSLVPGLVKLLVLTRETQVVLFAHVEISPGDHPANRRAGHNLLRFEVDLSQTRTVLA